MTASADTLPAPRRAWASFARTFAAGAAAAAVAALAIVLAIDPYGVRAAPGREPTPIMDLNQRYMYPQIIRSGRYDAAVFGSSTVRLLDPVQLGPVLGARVANLGLNAGTPWEQLQLLGLYLRHVPHPKALIFGIDRHWCGPDADAEKNRLTFRGFPPWLYDDNLLNDIPHLVSSRTFEIAQRVMLHRFGAMPERIRGDGYEVFTPPEASYDLDRARTHLYGSSQPKSFDPAEPAAVPPAEERALYRMPAVAWFETALKAVPSGTEVIVTFMPIHVAAQAYGATDTAWNQECKARFVRIAARRQAMTVDFQIRSDVTTKDENYWDPLHYRLPIADRIVQALVEARRTRRDAPDGFYRVMLANGSERGT